MISIGDLNQFGFRISPIESEHQLSEVSIFIGGVDLTEYDNVVYLPSFVRHLSATAKMLKQKINYHRYEHLFRDLNITQIHNLLLHGNPALFSDESAWLYAVAAHRFADWGEATDYFTAFLIPYCDRLYLTYQSRDLESLNYDYLDMIDGVEVTPYSLITIIEATIAAL